MLRSLQDLEPSEWIRGASGRIGALVIELEQETIGLCFKGQADVIQEMLDIQTETASQYRIGSAVTSDGVVDVLNIEAMRAQLNRATELVTA